MASNTMAVTGDQGAIEQRRRTSWTYPTGKSEEINYRGVYDAVKSLFDLYYAVSGYMPTLDSLNLERERGMGTLSAVTIEDGPIQYELVSNMVSFPIETHSHFTSSSPLTASEVHAVQTAIALGINHNPPKLGTTITEPAPFNGSAFSTKQQTLYNFLVQGVESYYTSAYVLRSSQVVSKRSQVQASYTGVNTVQTPPSTQAVNTLIGTLPSGEWLLQAPQVRMFGNRKWQVSQEWWWAPKWSAILYGGTGSP